MSSSWVIIDVAYVVFVALVCMRIVYDTTNVTKTMAYLLLAIFVPVAGILFYFSFGINYRKHKLYTKKITSDRSLRLRIESRVITDTRSNLKSEYHSIREGSSLVRLLLNDSLSPLTSGNRVQVLFNGEQKFPALLHALQKAKHHIHIQYYIYENDVIGNQIKDILIRKVKEGVKVRFLYDDLGSGSIRHRFVRELRDGGVEAYPFNKIRLLLLANRLNYRNHRKIVVIDGRHAFVGGINISDRYMNDEKSRKLFWRDTHLEIDGTGCHYLQYLFLCDWNFASRQQLEISRDYFDGHVHTHSSASVQIAASGPDSPTPTIVLSLLKALAIAKHEVLITTPYFIPGEVILEAIRVAALSGVVVKILVPGISDSRFVNAAAWSYYTDLLKAGVHIYFYRKGFVHAKTIVIDSYLSIVGTANMDYRSFDLNFEVNAIVYDEAIAHQLKSAFLSDLTDSERIDLGRWIKRPRYKQLLERIARLMSPLL